MSVCTTKSIQVNELSYESDFYDLPGRNDYEENFYSMIKTRRAIRNFAAKPVPDELLRKVIDAVSLAPPGFPPVKFELTVINSREKIIEALPYMIDFYDMLVHKMDKAFYRHFIRKEAGEKQFRSLERHMIPLMKTRLESLKAGTEDTITRYAPALILFHADKNLEDITADVDIAATYAMLAAHALGLGGSIMDIIPPAVQRTPRLREMFAIPEGNEVLSSVILGYPKYKYQRGIIRSPKNVRWI